MCVAWHCHRWCQSAKHGAVLQFLVTEVAEVGENEYLDPKAGKVHTLDHMEKVGADQYSLHCFGDTTCGACTDRGCPVQTVTASRDASPEEIGGAMSAAR